MSNKIIGFCCRCYAKQVIQNPVIHQFKSVKLKHKTREGMKAIKGTCPVCGTKMFKILSKDEKRLLIEDF